MITRWVCIVILFVVSPSKFFKDIGAIEVSIHLLKTYVLLINSEIDQPTVVLMCLSASEHSFQGCVCVCACVRACVRACVCV